MKAHIFSKSFSLLLSFVFTLSSITIPQNVQAQTLQMPNVLLQPTADFQPTLIKGMTLSKDNPFEFEFLMSQGDLELSSLGLTRGSTGYDELYDLNMDSRLRGNDNLEAMKMIKYFLASLAIPEENMWVNLSPHEPDRIIPDDFGQTQMGRDLLAQDYILKQFSASLMHPEGEAGREFWERIYQAGYERRNESVILGVTQNPVSRLKTKEIDSKHKFSRSLSNSDSEKHEMFWIPDQVRDDNSRQFDARDDVFEQLPDLFHKIWIVPETGYFQEINNTVIVSDAKLKVMLESDYVAEVASRRLQDLSFPRRRESTGHNDRYDQNMDPRLHARG